MSAILVVFRSRSETLDFCSRLKQKGVETTVVNTPKEANVGCGLSAKLTEKSLPFARAVVKSKTYQAFVGFFRLYNNNGKTVVVRYK